MAGIIADVSEDIRKLQQIKAEIASVKQELKSIDIRVRLDLKENIETRLQSLMKQYNEVVLRIAKVEGEAMLAATKIDEAINGISSDPLISFDAELMKMCSNLNKYFDDLLAKMESMSSLLQAGKTGIDGSTSNNVPTQQLEDLRIKNAELTEQLRSQKEEIKQQQEEWNRLATAIKTNNVSAIEQYKQATNSSSDAVKSAKLELKDLTKDLNENIKYYDTLAAQIASYKSILDRLYSAKEKGMTRVPIGDGATALISSELERFKPQLDDVTQKSKEIASQISEQRKRQAELNTVIEQGNEKHARTRTLILDAREQLVQMRSAGLQNTAQYQQIGQEAAKMRTQMALVNSEMEYLSNPNKGLLTLKTGLQGIAGSASLVVGIMGFFNQKSEDMIMLQTKIQSLLGIIIGLENTYNTVKKTGVLMRGIEDLQTKALIASQALEAKAKTTNIALTWSEVAAQKALNAVAKVNPYVLLFTAISTVVGGIWLLTKATNDAKKELEEFNKTIAENAAAPIAKVEELSFKWNRLGDNLDAKKKFVEDNKKAFNELGVAILDVVDAENLLNNNKDAFISAMIEKAKAALYIKEQEKNIAELIRAEQNIEAAKQLKFEDLYFSNGESVSAEDQRNAAIATAQYKYDEIAKRIKEGYTKAADAEEEGSKILDNARIKSTDNAENLVDDYTYKMMTGLERGNENFDTFATSISNGYKSLIDNMQDETTTFSQKIANLFGSLFSSEGNEEVTRLTIGERITQLRTDYVNAEKELKTLRSLGSTATQSEIDDAEKELNKIADIFKKLTGKSINDKSSVNQADKLRKQQEKLKSLQEKQAIERKRQDEDLEYQAAQARIDAMTEGSEKVQAQMRLDHQKEIQEIQRQKKEYIRARIEQEKKVFDEQEELKARQNKDYKKKTFDASTVTVDTSIFDEITKTTIERQGNDLAEYYKKVLSQYQDYATKRLEAKKKFDADLKKLEESGGTEAQKAELEYQREETYKSIDNEFAMREDTFQSWADGIADMSLEQLRKLLVNAERELERMEFVSPNNPQLAVQRAKVTSLKETISNKETDTSPDKRSIKEWQDLYNTLSKVERQFDEIGNTVGGTAGEIISAAGGIATSTLQMIDGIVTLANGSSEAMSGTAQAASASIQAVEKASVILAIIGAALQIATKLASLFGNSSMEYYESLKDELGAINEIYGDIIEKSKEKIVFGGGFAALESYREANDLLERQIENYRKLAEAGGDARKTGSHSYAYRANERLSGRSASGKSGVEAGKGRFEDISEVLGKNIKKVQDLYNLTGEELYLVQTKFPEAWSKIPEEITDNLQAIIDCREESEKLRDSLNEAITGVSFDSFYNEFIDMLSDMDMSAEDMAENFGEYLRKSILAAMVAKNFQEDINKLYDKWVAAGEEDSLGGMTITEDEARDIQDGYKELVDAMVQARDNMSQAFGWDSSATSQDSSSRGFQTMSQDTGEELNGRFTALQVAGEEIKNQTIQQTGLLSSINEKISLLNLTNEDIPGLTANIPDIAGQTRESITSSYQPQMQIIFPTEGLEVLADKMSSMERIVDEMRVIQIEKFTDVAEGINRMAKNTPVMNTKLDSINSGIKQFNSK